MSNSIKFGTIHSDGTLTNEREILQSDIGKCRFVIWSPEHYREDGNCKCSNKEHRKMMIKEWGYKERDFNNIPLID